MEAWPGVALALALALPAGLICCRNCAMFGSAGAAPCSEKSIRVKLRLQDVNEPSEGVVQDILICNVSDILNIKYLVSYTLEKR